MRNFLILIIAFFFLSCDSKNISREAKQDFTKKIENILYSKYKLQTYLEDFTNFTWDRICFVDSDITTLTFKDSKNGSIHAITLPHNYHIEGSYAEGSPIRDTILDNTPEVNCWGKGSLFTIKKYMANKKPHYLIQVGIEG